MGNNAFCCLFVQCIHTYITKRLLFAELILSVYTLYAIMVYEICKYCFNYMVK